VPESAIVLAVLRPALEEGRPAAATSASSSAARRCCSTPSAAASWTPAAACSRCSKRRAATLELLRASIEQRRPYVRVGEELDNPALSGVSLVGARYGLGAPLARHGLPTRPDADGLREAIGAVRAAAQELSRFVEDVYEEPLRAHAGL